MIFLNKKSFDGGGNLAERLSTFWKHYQLGRRFRSIFGFRANPRGTPVALEKQLTAIERKLMHLCTDWLGWKDMHRDSLTVHNDSASKSHPMRWVLHCREISHKVEKCVAWRRFIDAHALARGMGYDIPGPEAYAPSRRADEVLEQIALHQPVDGAVVFGSD